MRLIAAIAFAQVLLVSPLARGGVALTTLYSYPGAPGANPFGIIQGDDGNLYGTTSGGGAYGHGTIFEISNGVLVTLHSFSNGTDGGSPVAALVQGCDGGFYGATGSGGGGKEGTVFRVTASGQFTVLAAFNGTNGANPQAPLIQAPNGILYGTTSDGGAYSKGTVFSLTTNGVLTNLASFDGTNGASPGTALVLGADGNLYGTTQTGGAKSDGNVFELTTNDVLTNLYQFIGGDGEYPTGLMQGNDGNFYGTTGEGASTGNGAVFQLTTHGVLTNFYSFRGETDGSWPNGVLQGSDGNFHGTTLAGGSTAAPEGHGTIFELTTNGLLTNLAVFEGTNGSGSQAGLIKDADGNYDGTTYGGGSYGGGTVFSLTSAGLLSTLVGFEGNFSVGAGLRLQASNGSFYGATGDGGANHYGTVFSFTTNTSPTTLLTFNATNGPGLDNLLLSTNGNFYGTTAEGGASSNGSIFRINADYSVTVLYSFTGSNDGRIPSAFLQGPDTNFYGLTEYGGTNGGYGTFYRISPNGAFKSLYSFRLTNGYAANSLLLGSDGNFYGTAAEGGPSAYGSVYKITTNGVFTLLASFNETDGTEPGGLVQGPDGNFYGTFVYNTAETTFPFTPANYNGSVFKVTTNGHLSTLFSFSGNNGAYPALVAASGSSLFGVTRYGGVGYSGDQLTGFGTIFSITTNGAFTSLFSFGYTNGANPGRMVLGTDGNFYGATEYGGASGCGSLFELSFGNPPAITSQPTNQLPAPGSTATFVVAATGVAPISYVWQGNGVGLVDGGKITGSQTSALTITNAGLTDVGSYEAILANAYGSVTSSVAALSLAIPPTFQSVTPAAGVLLLNWSAVPRQTYQLQYNDNLSQSNWNNLGAPLVASNATLSLSNSMTNSQRFYRVLLLP
jgi:uncharacterized repeat protein (TIGR03803 family)